MTQDAHTQTGRSLLSRGFVKRHTLANPQRVELGTRGCILSKQAMIINQYFPPDSSATSTISEELARVIAEHGHRVAVLCGRPSYDSALKNFWRPLAREHHEFYEVERVGSTAFDRRRFTGRLANYASYLLLAGLRAALSRRPDVVVVQTDPPLAIWVGLLGARGRPLLYLVNDLHPEAAIAAGWVRPGRLADAWERLHTTGLRKADLVVCLGEDMAERIRAKGVSAERVTVVHHGARPPESSPDPKVVQELRAGAPFVALHAGNLGSAGAWETLAAAAVKTDDTVSLVFVGDGARADELRPRGLRVLPFRPIEELSSVMAAGDVQIVTLRSGLEGLVVPSKLYTALAHGRPVLAVVPKTSEVARIVKRWGCGVVADPDDPGDVAGALLWMRDHPEALAAMGSRAAAAGRFFDRDACLDRLVSLIETVARGGRRSYEPEAIPAAVTEDPPTPAPVESPIVPDYVTRSS